MITIQNPLTFTSSYPPKRLGAISDLLFFDIETTGFSGDYASVYLIGCVWHDGNTWILTQYFAETRDAEEEVLDAFFALLRTKRILDHVCSKNNSPESFIPFGFRLTFHF